MLTTHDPITTRDHLIDLARALTEADGQDPPDPARVGQLAWQILTELNEAAFGQIDAEVLLAQAQTAARAAAADAVSGSPDPLSHIRRLLAAQGGMPPAGMAATTILAWPGGRRPIGNNRTLIGGSGPPRGEISPATVLMRLPAGRRADLAVGALINTRRTLEQSVTLSGRVDLPTATPWKAN